MLPLLEKLDKLQAENTGLRDRNDELTVEVEALTAKLAALKTKKYVDDVDYSVSSKTCLSIPFQMTWNWGSRCHCTVFFCGGRNACLWPRSYRTHVLWQPFFLFVTCH